MRHLLRSASILSLLTLFVGVPSALPVEASPRILSGFPLLRQQHSLTCEAAAASMGTRGRITESQIMALTARRANPNLGFRGNPDGQQGTSLLDYGVYASPIHDALLQLGYRSDILTYSNDSQLMSYINRGWPVVVWITYQLQKSAPRLDWANGAQFFLVPHEHAILALGYDSSRITGNDPWRANRVKYRWGKFNTSWGYFGDMALAIQPCPMVHPVVQLRHLTTSSAGVTWAWRLDPNASQYKVKVIRHADIDQVMFNGAVSDHRFTLAAPVPGALYEIVVRSISSCGGVSDLRRSSTYVTAAQLTPTATASITPIPEATPTTTAGHSG